MTITDSARRLALVAVVAMLAALFPLSGALAQDPPVDEPPAEEDRIAIDLDGQTAVEYAIRWSQVHYDEDALAGEDAPTNALLGRDDVFADSLSSGVLQGAADLNAPLLLTPSDALSADTLAELDRLGVENVTVLGLEVAISEDVVAELEAEGYTVDRQGGQTRIETAIDIAEDVDSDTAILARAFGTDEETQAFADSLAAGGWAAEAGYPVLLTQTDTLTGNTATHLEEAGYTEVIIVGGEAAVSGDVEAEVGEIVDTVTRVGGGTRFETAVAIAEARGYDSPDDSDGTILVDGQVDTAWADGFPAAHLSGTGAPIVLSNSADTELPAPTREWFEGAEAPDDFVPENLTNVVLICGSTVPDGDEGSASNQCGEAADILGATVMDFVPPGTEEPGASDTGIVTAADTTTDTYTFQPEDGSDAVDVTYDADDTFTVDGTAATMAAFEANLTVGDRITFGEEDEDGVQSHDLVNQAPVEEGTVGFVDVNTTSFEIIEPVSGAIIGVGTVDYAADCDLYTVDGAATTESGFSDAISIGDDYAFDESGVAPSTVTTCNLENGSVTGAVEAVANVVNADPDFEAEFHIGNLGDFYDDTVNAGTVFFVDEAIDDQEFVVDGEASDLETFVTELSEGDDATYTRVNGIETFTLVNNTPATTSGQATDSLANTTPGDGGSFTVATNPGSETETYGAGARFIVDGVLATEADFEADYSAGDTVSYTPADAAAGTGETVSLTNENLAGEVNVELADLTAGAGEGQYDVLSAAGDVELDTVEYQATPVDRFFVDGEEVTDVEFEEALETIVDGDNEGTVEVTEGVGGAQVHSLTLTEA